MDGFAYFCSCVPAELLQAAGFVPVFIAPSGRAPAVADAHLPAAFCPYVRGCVDEVLGGGTVPRLAGAVVTGSCNPLQRLYDVLSARSPLPAVLRLDVPRRADGGAPGFFRARLAALLRSLEECAGRSVGPGELAAAVSVFNETRSLLRGLAERQQGAEPVPGSRLARVVRAGLSRPRGELNEGLRALAGEAGPRGGRRTRLLLAGHWALPEALLDAAEELGADVVWEHTCLVGRMAAQPVPAGGDVLAGLAEAYLSKDACPRMGPGCGGVEAALEAARAFRADAVIYGALKFCTPHAYGYAQVREGLGRAGLPCLLLEGDGTAGGLGAMQTRLQAFLETLAPARR